MKNTENVLNQANNMLSKAISKLEDEFRNLLTNYRLIFLNLHLYCACLFLSSPPCIHTCMDLYVSVCVRSKILNLERTE